MAVLRLRLAHPRVVRASPARDSIHRALDARRTAARFDCKPQGLHLVETSPALRAAQSARRRLDLRNREAAARKIANAQPREKRYFVRGVDLADTLPPEADLASIPGGGV